jgi:general stress protein 26
MKTPIASRPKMENYGISTEQKGLMEWSWADDQLTRSRNYWIASTRNDETPHVAPVWGLWIDGALYFGSARTARKTRNLLARPQVVVHRESGDEVVIVEGIAELVEHAALPDGFAAAYGQKYGFTPDLNGDPNSPYFRVEPKLVMGWLEKDFPNTATRWTF